jgi:tRNA threonylcarbamoyladenosine biosynthesis protein TsaE
MSDPEPQRPRQLVTEAELIGAGEALGTTLRSGEVVWLLGELGAGKTTMVQALARGLGVQEVATSPTYSLVHRYDGRRGPVYHVDCYRLRQPDEARDLDWEGLVSGDALLLEWPERAGAWAVPPTRVIRLEHSDDPTHRWFSMETVAGC